MTTPAAPATARRLRLEVAGAVQGVGMRPFLYRTARELGLQGWMRNDTRGVTLELEGDEADLARFAERLRSGPPPRAVVTEVCQTWLAATGLTGLEILPSDATGERVASVLPDLATCPACLADIGLAAAGADERPAPAEPAEGGAEGGGGADTPADRRACYPFTNCTDCGPRFSIIRALPYDRPNTTMRGFRLCPECRTEYEDPLDRRFHAQPTACPACGPHLWIEGDDGVPPPTDDLAAIRAAAAAIRGGRVVAVKGLGGFHLVVDAGNAGAVATLRARKHRPTKPLAVMVRDLGMARRVCEADADAAAALASPEAPIVLLPHRPGSGVVEGVAPGNPRLGIMLPYTPLHHLLMRELDRPVVATSGNLTDEPICTDNDEAVERLSGIADLFLLHDRPIERAVDDSVVQPVAGAPRLLRRSRGYAPLPVRLAEPVPPVLAVGGHLKNTVALARGRDVFLSQHIGDLETPQAEQAFRRVIQDFLQLYEVSPGTVAHDFHPDYASTVWAVGPAAGGADVRRVAVQHHHAHLAACLADNDEPGAALGVVWDGTGLGPDGVIWGGEFLLGDAGAYERIAHFRPFRLPGGDAAVKEPKRMALALAHAAWGEAGVDRFLATAAGAAMEPGELRVLSRVLETGFRAPWTTSAGRLFDAVASLAGLRQRVSFEGEAAMALEWAVSPRETGSYELALVERPGEPMVVDWAPAVDALLRELERGEDVGRVAGRFHNGLVAALVAVAERVGQPRVALTGGCFQNAVLTERAAAALETAGFRPLLHRRVPANDGGLALGQVAVAAAAVRES